MWCGQWPQSKPATNPTAGSSVEQRPTMLARVLRPMCAKNADGKIQELETTRGKTARPHHGDMPTVQTAAQVE